MSMQTICVVLATKDGAKWVSEQLRSIQRQSCREWRLFVSDDGSEDETRDIVLRFAAMDSRISLLPERDGDSGHVANFEYLLSEALRSESSAVFLCDQDDLWHPHKLTYLATSLEDAAPRRTAVFSDLELIDTFDHPIGSFMNSRGLSSAPSVHDLLCQNTVPGCAMAFNKALLEFALPFPEGLRNHDWWLALCAAALGSLRYHPDRLTFYRQHDGNAIGSRWTVASWPKLVSIVVRQRQVFHSKVSAVEELINRLSVLDLSVPDELLRYRALFKQVRGWSLAARVLNNEFVPRSLLLRFVQVIALSPLLARVNPR